jgi:hypothetical protein
MDVYQQARRFERWIVANWCISSTFLFVGAGQTEG